MHSLFFFGFHPLAPRSLYLLSNDNSFDESPRVLVGCVEGETDVAVRNTETGANDITSLASFTTITELRRVPKHAVALETIPKKYPLFKQCDTRWGSDMMVNKNLCAVGCLVSSTAMALNGFGITAAHDAASNPGTLNTWLRAHEGYVGNNMFAQDRLPPICKGKSCSVVWPADGFHSNNDLSRETIISYLTRGRVVIAHVRDKTHFVLGVGWDNANRDVLLVHDPAGRNETRFSMTAGVNGWRLFDMKAAPAKGKDGRVARPAGTFVEEFPVEDLLEGSRRRREDKLPAQALPVQDVEAIARIARIQL